MEQVTITAREGASVWEQVYTALRQGTAVLLRAAGGNHRSLRPALARHGFLADVVDGGERGLLLLPGGCP